MTNKQMIDAIKHLNKRLHHVETMLTNMKVKYKKDKDKVELVEVCYDINTKKRVKNDK
jgi:hypothetical protein